MPRGRHRHSPPLHRLLPPSAIAGVSVVCAFGPWVFSEPGVLRVVAAVAAATAVVGAAVMRRWDTQAGKQVADLTRARASDEWRHEERVAELETDLEESRELRVKLEQRLRAKRTELAGLRNEHAALLRRYATAETERASALEGRRLLEIETSGPAARALPPGQVASTEEAGAVAAPADTDDDPDAAPDTDGAAEETPVPSAIFSPEGSRLFLRAKGALARLDSDNDRDKDSARDGDDDDDREAETVEDASEVESAVSAEAAEPEETVQDEPGTPDRRESDDAPKTAVRNGVKADSAHTAGNPKTVANGEPVKVGPLKGAAPEAGAPKTEAAQEDEARGKPVAADGHERAAATTSAGTGRPAQQPSSQQPSSQRPSGHFIAPTAVAVVPQTPVRRPSVEGGFDFFGAKAGAAPAALEAVQNEDLADVVGQEALALHKAESEAEFKPADEESRGIGQVIDLTAHDETEQIDLQGLRSAVS
ncbi:secreted protein [Streptomyces lincolnensis]|uniref:Secreted protein n=1 Tax=Streptomyces lincolnensis TaxID=1915 RepID=A0A1B1MEJ7_STRLN|nr:hypothetical protein [Streptomyces lincolnensis]ANS66991.1 secreted protein [Streptomyces lincolnensis]AXG55863.1 secreted protein [Streptomyces lincolnensis]QMV07659.1 hypothetical protein GJU35_19570 [Streptomyces lincolnensis]